MFIDNWLKISSVCPLCKRVAQPPLCTTTHGSAAFKTAEVKSNQYFDNPAAELFQLLGDVEMGMVDDGTFVCSRSFDYGYNNSTMGESLRLARNKSVVGFARVQSWPSTFTISPLLKSSPLNSFGTSSKPRYIDASGTNVDFGTRPYRGHTSTARGGLFQ